MGPIAWIIVAYLAVSLVVTLVAHRRPREPVSDPPDWGTVEDTILDTKPGATDGGLLEVYRVWPEGEHRGVALLAHGWSRNRDKMTPRARTLGEMGFVTVMPSMRDHGNSSKYAFATAGSFAQDIETALNWAGGPVILYGHSAGAGGAIIAASRNPAKIRLLILEGCYTHTRRALFRLYLSLHPAFGLVFGPGILLWMEILHGFRLGPMSPVKLAGKINRPVLLIHGRKDEKFPARWVYQLQKAFPDGRATVAVIPGATHTEAGEKPEAAKAVRDFIADYYSEC